MVRSRRPLILTACWSCLAVAAAADEIDPYALSPEQLFDATVISASRTPENIWEAPAAIYVITSSDIERSGATSIPEALRLAPGVQVARGNSGAWAISVRGFNSALTNKLLVLIDGREVYDQLFSGVYWDVQDTALEDIERIEIIRGPGASLWGANAVNGVINIITKTAAETQGWLASVAAGNMERGVVTARYGGQAGDATQWRIYGRYFDRAGQETLSGGDSNGDWRAWRGGFRVDSALNARDSFTLQGDAYRSETGQYRFLSSLFAPYGAVAAEEISAQGGNVLGRWNRELGQNSRLTAQMYLDLTARTQATLKDRRTTFDIDAQYEFPTLGRHDVIAGVRYRHTADEITPSATLTSTHDTNREQLYSGFVQDQIALTPESWRLTLGAKVEHNDYTGVEIQPNARLQWMDGETQMAWASISRAVRSPSELEREFNVVTGVIPPGLFPVPVSVELTPSPDFESEEVIAYELGYRRQWTPDLSMDLAAFHNEYDGLATLTLQAFEVLGGPLHIRLPIGITNSTTADTSGFEAVLQWRASETLHFSASYSLLDMELHGPPASVAIASEAAQETSPRNQANLRAQWDVNDRLALDTTLYYVDELPAFQVEAYMRVDARLGWRVTDQVQFELVGQNLFDDAHREFGGPADVNSTNIERSIFGRLSWRS